MIINYISASENWLDKRGDFLREVTQKTKTTTVFQGNGQHKQTKQDNGQLYIICIGVECHFQQDISFIMTISLISKGSLGIPRKTMTCAASY